MAACRAQSRDKKRVDSSGVKVMRRRNLAETLGVSTHQGYEAEELGGDSRRLDSSGVKVMRRRNLADTLGVSTPQGLRSKQGKLSLDDP
ncbi:hypothetical protein RRG08_024863 [Elysia crispata]|uniref:Uncharacterized protein n=1 Tax=Elysia crispata TaxID=231223 RepID=A0AAE0YK11_9GAST|nr:hypothetical protein RRG08_024863 [Elysia crispata]